ncbi:hypothetical protein ABH924_004825 [Arthrobacter sp. GAS37]
MSVGTIRRAAPVVPAGTRPIGLGDLDQLPPVLAAKLGKLILLSAGNGLQPWGRNAASSTRCLDPPAGAGPCLFAGRLSGKGLHSGAGFVESRRVQESQGVGYES